MDVNKVTKAIEELNQTWGGHKDGKLLIIHLKTMTMLMKLLSEFKNFIL